MELQLYNTLSGQKEVFIPLDPGHITMYACGPTIYDRIHIGNARPLIICDVLFRLLQTLYPRVTYVRNITDVDDKIIARAQQQNMSVSELRKQLIPLYRDDLRALSILSATHEPLASQHIPEMIDIINSLLQKDIAYNTESDVMFHVEQIKNYGMLSKKHLDELRPGARIETAGHKKTPYDFTLWKKTNDLTWDAPFGKGRPGWHIECTAMCHKHLGTQIDIHCGGHDLIFPHHENEIAQHMAAFGCIPARYWIHNDFITMHGNKMSKSQGNVMYLHEAISAYGVDVLKMTMLSSHYKKPLPWTEKNICYASNIARKLQKIICDLGMYDSHIPITCEEIETNDIAIALLDNLNTHAALQALIKMSKHALQCQKSALMFQHGCYLLGLFQNRNTNHTQSTKKQCVLNTEQITQMIEQRNEARQNKNFQLSDQIRDELAKHNIILEDTKTGTTWRFED